MQVVNVRTLKRNMRITVPDTDAYNTLEFIDCAAEIRGVEYETMELPLQPINGFFKLKFPTGYVAEGTADNILSLLHFNHFNQSIREYPDALIIHAGLIRTPEGAVLIAGDKGDGKTTLMVLLALAGLQVSGDEHVILHDGMAIARPRTMRVKAGTLSRLPIEIADQVSTQASVRDWFGDPIYSVPPSMFGNKWVIEQARVKAIIVLSPNHGGRSRLTKMDAEAALPLLIRNTVQSDGNKLSAFMKLKALCDGCDVFELINGNLADAGKLVYELM